MRRGASFVLLAVSLVTLGSAASAAEPKPGEKSEFIDMETTNIWGTVKSPGIQYFKGRRAAQFERMLSLRKDMTPGIFSATKDPAFK